jgi:hypothetical protein
MRRRDAAAVLVLGLLAAALLAQNADAQSDRTSANYLLPACHEWIALSEGRAGSVNPSAALNRGYCSGIVYGLTYVSELLPPHLRSCPPKGSTRGQTLRVVVAYIERRPERMHEDFGSLAIEAMHEAWPCK